MISRDSQGRRVDQAHHLRQWACRAGPRGVKAGGPTHVVAVASGKGGVGKTVVAANLAIALAARGHRLVLLDMDMGLANADIVLGVEVNCTWRDVLAGRRSVGEIIVQGPGQEALVPGTSGVARMANLSEFERHQLMRAVEQIEDRYDVVVLDCGAGISQNVVGFTAWADTVLVVTTPEPTAITDAYAMIKAFAQDQAWDGRSGGSIGLIVNFADTRREGRDTYDRLAEVAARFIHLPVVDYGYILRDDHVAAAIRQRCPVVLRYPRCSASTCMMALAARVSREMGQPQADQSLFYRVMNMFL